MRTPRIYVLSILAACTHNPSPNRDPAPPSATITVPVRSVDSATFDSIARANPRTPEQEAAVRRTDSLAALIDTIVVLSPDSIVVRVGQSIQIFSPLLKKKARLASGELLSSYPSLVQIEDESIAQLGEAGLIGVRVGRTRLVLRVMNRHAHAPPSYIPVQVVP